MYMCVYVCVCTSYALEDEGVEVAGGSVATMMCAVAQGVVYVCICACVLWPHSLWAGVFPTACPAHIQSVSGNIQHLPYTQTGNIQHLPYTQTPPPLPPLPMLRSAKASPAQPNQRRRLKQGGARAGRKVVLSDDEEAPEESGSEYSGARSARV